MKKTFAISILSIALASGCTVISRKPDGALFYASFGTDKRIKRLEYDGLKIEGLNVNQTKGVKATGEGVAKGLLQGAKGGIP